MIEYTRFVNIVDVWTALEECRQQWLLQGTYRRNQKIDSEKIFSWMRSNIGQICYGNVILNGIFVYFRKNIALTDKPYYPTLPSTISQLIQKVKLKFTVIFKTSAFHTTTLIATSLKLQKYADDIP